MLNMSTSQVTVHNHRTATIVTAVLALLGIVALFSTVPVDFAVFILFAAGIVLAGGAVLIYTARQYRRFDDE
ncbi:hypothetical protein [Sciscionella sediminilitoris]|uniref:hypothetical protein n=1 Tax=Sciscionella sediminilitoris TaxID=1445613 RepID=UPI0004DECE0C|nr:hypothetical protein [Sciscionella sp. SE31]